MPYRRQSSRCTGAAGADQPPLSSPVLRWSQWPSGPLRRVPAPTPNPQGILRVRRPRRRTGPRVGGAEVQGRAPRYGRARSQLRSSTSATFSKPPCTDAHYRTALDRFNGLRHPVVYTPGDNEWTDCWLPGSGSFAPRERLTSLRKIFFADPHQSLGGRRVPLRTQADHREFSEFVETVRWSHAGVTFATVHLLGSRNGQRPFPNRTAADDEEVQRRTEARQRGCASHLRKRRLRERRPSFSRSMARWVWASRRKRAFAGTSRLPPRSRRKSSVSASQCSWCMAMPTS